MNSKDSTTRSAVWAAEFSWYLIQGVEILLKTAEQTQGELKATREPEEWRLEEWQLAAKTRAMAHTSALQALLAIEIALKAYQIRDTGQHTHTHNLQCLFDSLKDATRTRLENLGPEVKSTLQKYPKGFVALRYPFEQLGNSEWFYIPRPTDPLYAAATNIVKALKMDFFGRD